MVRSGDVVLIYARTAMLIGYLLFRFLPSLHMIGTGHQKKAGQVVQENDSNPVGHLVRPWSSEIFVDDKYSQTDGEDVHNKGKQ